MVTPEAIGAIGALLLLHTLDRWQIYREREQWRAERETWNRERNALIERLVPGSTPQPEPTEFRPIIGDDRREWLASLDAETRAQVELERANGRVE